MEGDPPNAEDVNAIRAAGTQFLTETPRQQALEPAHGEAGVSGFGAPSSTCFLQVQAAGRNGLTTVHFGRVGTMVEPEGAVGGFRTSTRIGEIQADVCVYGCA